MAKKAMSIRENRQYRELEQQILALKTLRLLRPVFHLMGAKGREALQALDQLPALERQLQEHVTAADEFNACFIDRGWVAHEYMNYELGRQAVALARSGDADAAERLLIESITADAELRRAADLSQADLAETLEVATNTISRWETATYKPTAADLAGLARIFNVPVGSLFPPDLQPQPGVDQTTQALMSTLGDLPPDDIEELKHYAEFKRARRLLESAKGKRRPKS